MRYHRSLAALVPVLSLLAAAPRAQANGPPEGPTAALADLPLAFVENAGQWEAPVLFRAANGPLTAFLERDAITLDFASSRAEGCAEGVVVRLAFEGASADVVVHGDGALIGVSDFFVGERAAHRTGVPSFAAVRYRELYPGVDLVARDGEHLLEYDLVLAPGAALDQVVVRCAGVDGLRVDADGTLVLETARGPVRQAPPVTWQEDASGARTTLACCYRILDATRYGFAALGRDAERTLVVDPGLEWSTYVNGPGKIGEFVQDVAFAPDGQVVACGQTYAIGFPTTVGAYDTTYNGSGDAYVLRFDPAQTGSAQLLYSTFLGGSGIDRANSCSVDDLGVLTVVGLTESANFPTTPGAFDETDNPARDAFVCRVDPAQPSDKQLVYSTFLGGSLMENGNDHAVDVAGVITVVGWTESPDFPTTTGAWDTSHNGGEDLFVLRLDPTLAGAAQLLWSTLIGGSGDEFCYADNVAIDGAGVVVAGSSDSPDFPTTPGAFQIGPAGGFDAVVCRLDPALSGAAQLVASTYLGGLLDDLANSMDTEPGGTVTVGGSTSSADFPTTAGALQPAHPAPGTPTAFLARMDTGLGKLTASTFLGGSAFSSPATVGDLANTLVTGRTGLVTLGGSAGSSNFPTTAGAFQETFQGGGTLWGPYDGFLARFSPALDRFLYSTYLGGTASHDFVYTLAVDERAYVLAGGVTQSSDFPTTPFAYDGSYAGSNDGFLTLLDMLPTGVSAYGASTPGCHGPLAMGVTTKPAVGDLTFEVFCTNAPVGGTGFLGFGLSALPVGVPALGVDL